jgi:hypothetical protein
MQVAKITLFNGDVYYTSDCAPDNLGAFFGRVRAKYGDSVTPDARNQVDLIEMTPEEYQAIPATVSSAELFGGG